VKDFHRELTLTASEDVLTFNLVATTFESFFQVIFSVFGITMAAQNRAIPIGLRVICVFLLLIWAGFSCAQQEMFDKMKKKLDTQEILFVLENFDAALRLGEGYMDHSTAMNYLTRLVFVASSAWVCMDFAWVTLCKLMAFVMASQMVSQNMPLATALARELHTTVELSDVDVSAFTGPSSPHFNSSGRPNIILFISESTGFDVFALPNQCKSDSRSISRNKSSFVCDFLTKFSGTAVAFFKAFASSGDTGSAHTSILNGHVLADTGCRGCKTGGKASAWERYMSNLPGLADVAKSSGYTTAVYSSTDTLLGGDRFVRYSRVMSHGYNTVVSPSTTHDLFKDGLPNEVTGAAKDRRILKLLTTFLEGLTNGTNTSQPYFVVVSLNNMHIPRKCPHACGGGEMFDLLVPGLMDVFDVIDEHRTVVAFSADHGDDGRTNRVEKPTLETLRIPLLFHIPNKFYPSEVAMHTFRSNINRPVTNLDVFPTLVEMMGYRVDDLPTLNHTFGGASLFRTISPHRVTIGNQGWPSTYKEGKSIILRNLTHCVVWALGIRQGHAFLYNIEDDAALPPVAGVPWDDMAQADIDFWANHLRINYKRRENACPV
jgi:hypothetical protein